MVEIRSWDRLKPWKGREFATEQFQGNGRVSSRRRIEDVSESWMIGMNSVILCAMVRYMRAQIVPPICWCSGKI